MNAYLDHPRVNEQMGTKFKFPFLLSPRSRGLKKGGHRYAKIVDLRLTMEKGGKEIGGAS